MKAVAERSQTNAELTRSELMFRRLRRPQTYYRLAHAAFDSVITWPAINRAVDARVQARGKSFFFVEIGANDGERADPINTRIQQEGWAGLLVEPVPRYFAALQATYAGRTGLRFAQVAISHEDGSATMYAINPNNSATSKARFQ